MTDTDFPVALTRAAEKRIQRIADDHGTTPYDVIRTFAEEGALNYFRHRSDDPASPERVMTEKGLV